MHSAQPVISAGSDTAVVIPAYRPSRALVEVVRGLARDFPLIVIVDDGSGPEHATVFEEVCRVPGVRLYRHDVNRGKGAALKTGISHALAEFPFIEGVITADADGQHLPEDIVRVRERFRQERGNLVLGSRAFDRDVPWRSQFGNTITCWAMRLLVGAKLCDTQTGLRAIPREFAAGLLHLPTTRYEFELDMLMAAREQAVGVVEEPIRTVYEHGNASSHFNPLFDSMRIYFVLLRFCSTSLLTALIDNLAFYLAYRGGSGLLASQIAGRAVAVLFNYLAVRSAVFYARDSHRIALPRFLALVAASGTAAYFGIQTLVSGAGIPVLWAKIAVESLLFFVNFAVQRHWVFPGREQTARSLAKERLALWLALALGLGALAYGFWTFDVFRLPSWTPAGERRFRLFTIAFAAASLVFAVFARRYFAPVLIGSMVVCTALAIGVVPVLALMLVVFSCTILGRWLSGDGWVTPFLAGLALWSGGIGVLSALPVHYPAVYLSVLLGVVVLRRSDAANVLSEIGATLRGGPAWDWRTYAAFSLAAFLMAAHWFTAIKPEVSADGLAMHLTIAANIADHHRFTFDFRQFVWALMPMGADYSYTLAYMLGGEGAARMLNFTMLGCIASLIVRISRDWVSLSVAILLAASFLSASLVQLVTGAMMVENFVAATALGAASALRQFRLQPSGRNLLLCAFLLGSAVAWKLSAIAIACVLLPAIAVFAVRHRRMVGARPAWAAALLFLAIAAFPYAKAYVVSGNPVYPFGNDFFKSPYISEDLRDGRYQEKLTWRTPMQVTFETSRYYEGQDGSFGFQYVLFLPLCAFAAFRCRDPLGRVFALTGIAGSAMIIGIQPNARYLYPALPFLTIGAAAALNAADRNGVRTFVLALGTIGILNVRLLPSSNWYHRDFFLRPIFAERGRAEYIQASAPIREVVNFVNQNKGAVMLTQGSDVAGIRGPVFANHWHNLSFRKKMEAAESPAEVYGVLQEREIVHLVAPKVPDASELAQVPALHSFLSICATPQFETERYSVLAIAPDCGTRLRQ